MPCDRYGRFALPTHEVDLSAIDERRLLRADLLGFPDQEMDLKSKGAVLAHHAALIERHLQKQMLFLCSKADLP